MVAPLNDRRLQFQFVTSRHVTLRFVDVYVPKGPKEIIPYHDILSIITLWNPMMDVMDLGIKDGNTKYLYDDIKSCMIPTGQDAPHG